MVATIIPLIQSLSKDVEPVVKQHLVEQLKGLAKVWCLMRGSYSFNHCAQLSFEEGGEVGYRVVLEQILPVVGALLEDEKQEVRQSASATLAEVARFIRTDDIGQHVLTIILVRCCVAC